MYNNRRISAGKLTIFFAVVCLVLIGVIIKGSGMAKQRRLEAQINSLTGRRDSLSQTLEDQRQHFDELTRTEQNQKAELEEYKASVERYMTDHLQEVSALVLGVGGLKIAMDKDNVFTQDAKTGGGIVAFISAIWAVDHAQEIASVAANLNAANAAVHTRETAITGTASSIQQEKIHMEAIQADIDRLNRQIEGLETQPGRRPSGQQSLAH
jgi:chromosome segregation ATPase